MAPELILRRLCRRHLAVGQRAPSRAEGQQHCQNETAKKDFAHATVYIRTGRPDHYCRSALTGSIHAAHDGGKAGSQG
jgi:hypothetical protein